MIEKRTVFGVDAQNVHRFLDDCLASPPSDDELNETARFERLLQEQLSEKCPVSGPLGRSGSWLLDRMQEKVLLDMSRPAGEVLSDDQTSLDTLRSIKGRYKKWSGKAPDKRMQRVYAALYFAAVARALISHNKRITRHPPAYLIHSFRALAAEPWMDPAMRELYLKAQQACTSSPPT